MPDTAPPPADEPTWVVWNGALGLLATARTGRVEPPGAPGAPGRAWLAAPFEMVGPFDLAQLVREGRIHFAACTVMSRARWQADQVALRRESQARRRANQERVAREQARRAGRAGWGDPGGHGPFGGNGGHGGHGRPDDPARERHHRALLKLPADGPLQPRQIKTAYRRLAQRAHPDMGGSHEAFVQLTEARDGLLAAAG